MSAQMNDGDEIRLLGTGGAPVLLTVGCPFSAEEIEKRLNSGEWRREGSDPATSDAGPQPRTEKLSKPSDDPGPGPKPRTEKLSKPADDRETGGPQPRTELLSAPEGDGRPAVNAPKSEWAAYVSRTRHISLDDANAYTKSDLIDMVS
ncbi:hypothetical protein ACFWMT_00975 [Streptomyces sp. NPDC058368]|uniref:hypothetical protein n=1 Tax=Streptomyces sp. NPDC058368 TaxID=3346461 RepID=UPI003669A354